MTTHYRNDNIILYYIVLYCIILYYIVLYTFDEVYDPIRWCHEVKLLTINVRYHKLL